MRLEERTVVATVGRLSLRQLRAWVRKGWIRPVRERRRVVFTDIDLARIRLVCHLKQDLDVNDEAIPVVLSLMDQVYGLRRELRSLAQVIEEQPPTVQQRIAEAMRSLSER